MAKVFKLAFKLVKMFTIFRLSFIIAFHFIHRFQSTDAGNHPGKTRMGKSIGHGKGKGKGKRLRSNSVTSTNSNNHTGQAFSIMSA